MDKWPRDQAFIWDEKPERRTVYELPVKMGAGLQWSMEIRCYDDGRTTMKLLKFPRSRGRMGDL